MKLYGDAAIVAECFPIDPTLLTKYTSRLFRRSVLALPGTAARIQLLVRLAYEHEWLGDDGRESPSGRRHVIRRTSGLLELAEGDDSIEKIITCPPADWEDMRQASVGRQSVGLERTLASLCILPGWFTNGNGEILQPGLPGSVYARPVLDSAGLVATDPAPER